MKNGQCIISGYVDGRKFRPSNWSERLCEAGAIFDPLKRVMRYSEHLHPRQCEQYGCSVYVNFDALDDGLVRHINWFIESNGMAAVPLPGNAPVLAGVADTPKTPVVTKKDASALRRTRRRKAAA